MTDFYTAPGPSPWFSYMGDVPMPHNGIDWGIVSFGLAFEKGYTPPPVTVENYADGSGLRLIFDSDTFSTTGCICNIDCSGAVFTGLPTDAEGTATVCPVTDGYSVDVVTSGDGIDPVVIEITYTDALGNESSLEIDSIYDITHQPLSYWVSEESGVDFIELAPPFLTSSGTQIRDSVEAWQVQKYVTNEANAQTCVDWTTVSETSNPVNYLNRTGGVARVSLTSGTTYGFRVRYRSYYGEVSPWSDWITATV